MTHKHTTVQKQIHISRRHADRLQSIAQIHHLSDDQLIEQALDMLFMAADLLDGPGTGRIPNHTDPVVDLAERERTARQRLLEAGLVTRVSSPARTVPTSPRVPIRVAGKPLSETILEERR
jgi:hypothetical protein